MFAKSQAAGLVLLAVLIHVAQPFQAPVLSPQPSVLAQRCSSVPALRQTASLVSRRQGLQLNMQETTESAPSQPWSPAGMDVVDFFKRSVGDWRSLRSSHNIAFAQLEEVNTDIEITNVGSDDEEMLQICKTYDVDPTTAVSAIRMAWEGYSDWDEDEVVNGSTVLVVVQDSDTKGRLLRSVGYTETIPSAGDWEMQEDGTFVLHTLYDRAAAEERIWFATPDLRMRVSMIKTQGGKGVLTASLSTEVRQKPKASD